MEDLKSPILVTRYEQSYLTAGCWSPTRPGVFYTSKLNGTLDIWDLFYKHNDPVYTTRVGEASLTSISVQNEGRLVAVGASEGSTTLLEVSPSLYEPQNNEKASIAQMFERENKREKNLEVRATQLKRERKTSKVPAMAAEVLQTEAQAAAAVPDGISPDVERLFNEAIAKAEMSSEREGEAEGEDDNAGEPAQT